MTEPTTKQTTVIKPIPWYKNYILLLIIFIPLATVCASGVTIYLAVSSKEAPVLDNYFKVGLSPQKQHFEPTTIQAVLSFEKGDLILSSKKEIAEPLELVMQHASKSEFDQTFTLYPRMANVYALPPQLLQHYNQATWYFYLSPVNGNWRIQGKRLSPPHGSVAPAHEKDIILQDYNQ